ncbi:hypothetical protein Slin15195_G100010 [Septoria linicola]|uniref:DUF7907 domain-containing protein n=1 Tax=Septoria linicola TaxID=215465 RepID=A0A9Q9B3E0_9PEZI|nr:hypothetical protein Slin15195_G100010 [Septoria linicola]
MILVALLSFVLSLVAAALNTTSPQFQIQTQFLPASLGQAQYNNLWLSTYHTGAGLNDVVFQTAQDGASKAFLNSTNVTGSDNLLFDLGNTFAWGLVMVPNAQFYSAWQPVEIHAGASGSNADVSGFFVNSTGLQWNSTSFGGWMVCDWWHGVPQLFFRISYYVKTAYPAPSSCADVYLVPRNL